MQVILSRAHFALQDGKGPLITGVLAMVINLMLSFTLIHHLQIGGPALASAVAISVAAIGLFILLRLKMPVPVWTKSMSLNATKMLLASVAMFGVVHSVIGPLTEAFNRIFGLDTLIARILTAGSPVAIGAVVYMTLTFIFSVPEAKTVFKMALSNTRN